MGIRALMLKAYRLAVPPATGAAPKGGSAVLARTSVTVGYDGQS
jgi:hypothetical protein